ncbi:type-F conjugative transfer system pilin assembly protein TraF [Vibrio parahaemolyticus]|uniref:Type-F conjugative transfer system pilin assembly protein TraF n=1 Tax=Vibrio parahaemolyticus TaxID=670 RepID=A0A9Q3YLM4_VIBPH|nr:type-F conjugative transfer system pilin assembly protein TraF [Vibrio parahaemolyticus]EGQ8101960.1 type-F conjugative transfer system pilin assembly protein TraF [Vibrio parahaemolyticus]EGQ9129666.1 type-F conjugative transfer system pilin assembly protein TraF [Vibrio parahaemolyticus]EHA6961309.1 type-F conjugative transfer system pilin assembly protein TraF [Vibrio parahaemolyticus]EHA6975685.1 type-F conjugative transfer system pilin assembly protein TraF [Vibrio parahaemolyticus]EJB
MNSPWHRLERYLKTAFQFIALPLFVTITIQALCFVGVVYCALAYHPTPEWHSTLSPSDWQKSIKCLWQLSLEYTALLHFFIGISILTYTFIQNKAKSLSKKTVDKIGKQLKVFTLLILFLPFFSVHANTLDKPKGWRWYNEPKTKTEQPIEEVATPQNSVTTVMSATEQMQWFHQEFNEALNDATINPTDEEKNLKVMRLKKFIDEKTTQTGMTFKKLITEYPEFSYTKDRPTEQAARDTYYQTIKAKNEASVRQLVQEGWGIYFIYEGQDDIAKTLAPSVQDFANRYHVELVGISKDGLTFEAINENRIDKTGRVNVRYTPALMLANIHTKELKPLAYGFISQTDLLSRFHNIATNYQDSDF